jgi:hypothetical protein
MSGGVGVFSVASVIAASLTMLLVRAILTARVDQPNATAVILTERPKLPLLRLLLITIMTLGGIHLVFTELVAVRADIGRWAGIHDLDGDLVFASALLVVSVGALGITILFRRRLNLGLRSADRLFREFFWALFTVAVALLPPTLRASWAPTMLAALAAPLLVARIRLSLAPEPNEGDS